MKKPHRTNKLGSGISWAWLEIDAAELAREKAGKHGFSVYCALCILESKAGQNHKTKFTASIQEIAKISGLGETVVKQAIKSLRASDLMTVVSGGLPEKSNIFSLHNAKTPESQGDHVKGAWRPSQSREATSSESQGDHQIKGRKDSSPTEKESLSSEKGEKGADAGTPPGKPGGSDSAPEETWSCVGNF